jgi:hypothetical protein
MNKKQKVYYMSYPKNPYTIILKNEYYPQGLRESEIWNYYQKIKNNLLKETIGKVLIVFFATGLNKTTVIRKNKSKELIRLTPSDYNTIVSGRTLSFHSTMDRFSRYGIIDIDTDDFNKAKDATITIYNILDRANFTKGLQIRFSGKRSFHLKVDFNSEYKIEYIRKIIFDYLIENNIHKKYTIAHKRFRNIPNIDLNRNIYNAGHITLYSLAITGLRCLEVPIRKIKSFKKEDAKIQ